MKSSYLFILSFLFLISCKSDTEIIEGKLFFKLIDILPSKGLASDEKKMLIKLRDSLSDLNYNSTRKNSLIRLVNLYESKNLLDKPNFRLQQSNDSIALVFLTPEQFKKFEKFHLPDLMQTGEQVNIKLKAKKIEENVFQAEEIITVEKVKGKTNFEK